MAVGLSSEMALTSEELARWYFVLRSPVRIRILRLLAERGPTPFKELRRELGLGVGTIYYHLSIMAELVAKDRHKRYYLTELGLRLYRALEHDAVPLALRKPTGIEKAFKALLLSPLFKLACEKKALGVPLALAIVLLGGLGCARAGLMPVMFFFVRSSAAGWLELLLHYMGQWAAIFLLCELLVLALYRQPGAELELSIGVGLASLPMGVFPYIYMVLPMDISARVLPFLQLWSILLVCSAVSLGKGMRIDRALPIGFILMFLNMVLLVFGGFLAL